jgi:hypothetical protein
MKALPLQSIVFAAAGLHALCNYLFELCARERDHHEVKG